MIDVQRVDYIRVPVADMEKASHFYGQVLGLQRNPTAWQASLRGALPNRTFDIEVVPPARAAHTGGTCGGVGAD